MIREQVVVTPIEISIAGQVKHFQVKLPKNSKRIIGVELGWRLLQNRKGIADKQIEYNAPIRIEPSRSKTFFRRNILIGDVKLQSCEEANIFYAGNVQTDENIAMGDFSQNQNWMPSAYTHQANSFEERIIVDGDSTMIQGLYRDRLGEQYKISYNYLVNVYVWIEIEEPTIKE